jgi:cyclophilin family peptidyl-prolyl cis-trans isomerase
MQQMAEAFQAELQARARDDARGDLPRVAFETTGGRVVVELFAGDAPKAVDGLLSIVRTGGCTDVPFDAVTGAMFAQATLQRGGALDEESHARRAFRGTLALAKTGALLFRTGHDGGPAVGRVVLGMEVVDALDAGDRIRTAEVVRERKP